jgi:hypothetical protein
LAGEHIGVVTSDCQYAGALRQFAVAKCLEERRHELSPVQVAVTADHDEIE